MSGPWEEFSSTVSADSSPWNDFVPKQNLTEPTVKQVAGEIPTKSYFKSLGKGAVKGATFQDLSQEEQETPGMQLGNIAGSMIPMAVAEALVPGTPPPLVKAGLGGMVYGASKAAVAGKDALSQLSDIAGNSLGFMAGNKLGQAVGKVLKPFSGSVNPTARAATEAATKEGINLPLSNRTDSKMLEAGERVLEYSPFGSFITKKRDVALQGLKKMTDRVGAMIGPSRPPEVTGNLAKEATIAYKEAYDTTKNQLYDAVMPTLKDTPVKMDNTIQALEDVIARRAGPGEPAGLNMVRKWLKEIRPKNNGNPSMLIEGDAGPIQAFNQLRKLRTNVGSRGKFNDPAASGLQSDISQIYAAASKDLDDAAGAASPEIKDGLAKADEFFQQGKITLKSKVYKALQAVNPENTHKVVIVPNSPSQVEIGREILGDNFKDVARQWFDDGVKKATDPNGVVSPAKLSGWLNKYGSTVDAIASGNPILEKQLDSLKKIASAFGRGKEVTGGSQTAYIVSSLTQIIGTIQAAFSNPALAAKLAAGIGVQGLAVKGITSDVGTKYLTTGFPKAAQKVASVAAPPAKAGLSNLINEYLKGK
jgi:hypothetical protein